MQQIKKVLILSSGFNKVDPFKESVFLTLYKYFQEFFYFKNVLVTSIKIFINTSSICFYLDIFLTKKKLLKIKTKINKIKNFITTYKKNKNFNFKNDFNKILKLDTLNAKIISFFLIKEKTLIYKKTKNLIFLSDLFKKINILFKNSYIKFKLTVLNKFISKKFFRSLKKKFKFFKKKLFNRRLTFYLDFIRILILYKSSKIKFITVLSIFCDIFKRLTKRLHAMFFVLIKKVFNFFMHREKKFFLNKKKLFFNRENLLLSIPSIKFENLNFIKGIKFNINGKIKGKLRAKSYNILIGSVPKNNKNTKIEYYKMHSYTVYGKFGLKFWIHRI
jgi:hypothetical protein